ncbi:MAG: 4-hydroxy-3-methylbut-2-enyl diphosphate reductase, partial [Synergistaceae bacterium]|nr:4-hydroxy-3-methylbut-2-enyl diphosphate reductase [Synergistaceae bacterium]
MKIIMAKHAGFCFGVKRAVDAIENALKTSKEVWTIGLPIHNPQEVARLEKLGLRVAKDESEIPSGSEVLIRAHGEPLDVIEKLQARDVEVRDMTCPFVKKAQELAAKLSEENYHVILLGDKNHPEIKGILGHIRGGNAEVVINEDEAENVANYSKIALISQTTQREERLANVAGILTRKSSQLHVCNTICKATGERQDAVKELVKNNNVDGVVLIGGKASANTGKLRDIIKSHNIEVLWIEDENEIESNSNWFKNKNTIGIAAGA